MVCNNCYSQDTTFYQIINDLLKDSTLKTDIVIAEINVIHKYSELSKDSTPPVFGVIYYGTDYFLNLGRSGLIQPEDVDYMYNQINGKFGLMFDSLMVNKRVLPMRIWNSINERNTKKLSFIYFSDPLYGRNKESSLLSVWINDVGKVNEKTLFLKLENGKWSIANVISTRKM